MKSINIFTKFKIIKKKKKINNLRNRNAHIYYNITNNKEKIKISAISIYKITQKNTSYIFLIISSENTLKGMILIFFSNNVFICLVNLEILLIK